MPAHSCRQLSVMTESSLMLAPFQDLPQSWDMAALLSRQPLMRAQQHPQFLDLLL